MIKEVHPIKADKWLGDFFSTQANNFSNIVYSKIEINRDSFIEDIRSIALNDDFIAYDYYSMRYYFILSYQSKVLRYKAKKEIELRSDLFSRVIEIKGEGEEYDFLEILKFSYGAQNIITEFAKLHSVIILTKEDSTRHFLEKEDVTHLLDFGKHNCMIKLGDLLKTHLNSNDIMLVLSPWRDNVYVIFDKNLMLFK